MEVCDQERNIISLYVINLKNGAVQEFGKHTLTGFRRRMKKASARCIRNRVNLCTRMCSISSACLILILTRTLFMLGSMKTRSFSFRATVNGFSKASGELTASTSGTLCLSEICDAKFERDNAAVKDDRTHWRYGLRDCDWGC
jgi:hypothetical protein